MLVGGVRPVFGMAQYGIRANRVRPLEDVFSWPSTVGYHMGPVYTKTAIKPYYTVAAPRSPTPEA